jgi:TusA-related sulfurtransferase
MSDKHVPEILTVDCLGDICPLPLMKFREMKKALEQGREIMLVTDHSCAAENVLDYCRSLHYQFEVVEPISGVWEIYVRKAP